MSTPTPIRPALGPRQLSNGRRASVEPRLGAIDEDGGMQPDVPARAHNRPFDRMFALGFPPRRSQEHAPPPYSQWDEITGPRGEKFSDVRNNRYLARRGGWKRCFLILVLVICIIVALVVGLVVGLKHGHHHNGSPNPPSQNDSFPAGSYSFTTFLDDVQADCTSNAATWQCFPYTTYNQSATGAMTTFDWIITPTNNSQFVISSSNNPFALTFSNATLNMVDAGLSSEAYTFQVPMDKQVIPTTALTDDNSASICDYNGTTFSATLYTKMASTYPSSSSASNSSSGAPFRPWPHAVSVQQVIGGGVSVPSCYKTVNGNRGDRIPLDTEPAQSNCRCAYQNFGT